MLAWMCHSLFGCPSPSTTSPSSVMVRTVSGRRSAGLCRGLMRKRSVPGSRALRWPNASNRPCSYRMRVPVARSCLSASISVAATMSPPRGEAVSRRPPAGSTERSRNAPGAGGVRCGRRSACYTAAGARGGDVCGASPRGSTGMILSDRDILREIEAGRLAIEPFERECVQPSSVDLHLGNQLLLFRNSHRPFIDVKQPVDELMEPHEVPYGESFAVHPLEVLLASTYEAVTLPDDLVARLEGKSSLARLGLQVHATAGFVDPGWHGHLTLELSNVTKFPILIYPGMKVVQISFMRMSSPVLVPYGSGSLHSKYQGESGPMASRFYQEFASGRAMAAGLRQRDQAAANGTAHPRD